MKACNTNHDMVCVAGVHSAVMPRIGTMMGANLAPTSLVCVGRAGGASRAARLRMLLAPSSPTSQGDEQEFTHDAAPACCRFEALAGYSMLAGQEPCFDGLCMNEAWEGEEEVLLPQKCVWHQTVLGHMMTTQ